MRISINWVPAVATVEERAMRIFNSFQEMAAGHVGGAGGSMSVFNGGIAPTTAYVNQMVNTLEGVLGDLDELYTEGSGTTRKYAARAHNSLDDAINFVRELISSGAVADATPGGVGM